MAVQTVRTSAAPQQTWEPSQIGDLFTKPVGEESLALQVATSATASAACHDFRIPVVNTDPVAAWVDEGEEIAASSQEYAEEADYFHKLAGLTVISREMAEDTSPGVATEVGRGLARDIARKIDAAFFGTRGGSQLAPRGLEDLTNVTKVEPNAFDSLDPFHMALHLAQLEGAALTAFVANPGDAIDLALLKDEDGSRRPLLASDPTQATRRLVAGVPLYVSKAVKAGTVWGIPRDRVVIAVREDVSLTRDESVFFTSDRIAIRATMRATFLYPNPGAIVKITKTAA